MQYHIKAGKRWVLYSDSFNLTTHVNKKVEEWKGYDDLIHRSEKITFVADGDSNPYFIGFDVGSTENIMVFEIFPVLASEEGTQTQLPVDLSNGNFICDGFRNVFNDSLILKDNTFYDVVTMNTFDYYVPQIFYSKQYGVIGYSAPGEMIFSIKP